VRSEESNITASPIKVKSMAFALRIIKLSEYLNEKNRFVLSKQILKSGTSIGANAAEASCGISTNDFLAKLYISFKECSETLYWLELLHKAEYISDALFLSLNNDCMELYRMISSATKTTSTKKQNN
jgi:four helix bundle protein